MITIKNDQLIIGIKKVGAELCEISSAKNGTQFMWNADATIWGNFAPNLFPIIGMLKEDGYYFEGKKYHLSKHGFVRNNTNFQIVEEKIQSATLRIVFDEQLLKIYPFKFEYDVIYHLDKNILNITYKVRNIDSKTMYFSVGGHPAFKCPVFKNEVYSNYQLVFENDETSKTHILNLQTGLVTNQTKDIFDSPKTIRLRPDLFDHDALIFTDLFSRKVTLNSDKKGDILTVEYKDFPFLGLWAKPKANYVCIEPWIGIADSENTNQQFVDKEGIVKLDAGVEFSATYSIQIHQPHLI